LAILALAATAAGVAIKAQAPATPASANAPAAPPQFDSASFAALQWRNIGPFRGGRAVAAAGVPQQPRTFYFGSVGGGVWKTTDGGETWTNITDGQLKTSSVGAIAIAPSDPNVIYVGMGEHAVRGVMTSHGDGVYKSTDAGRTWTHMGLDRTRHISKIRVHPTEPDTVYVAAQGAAYGATSDRGVYRSTDGGKTWSQILFVNEGLPARRSRWTRRIRASCTPRCGITCGGRGRCAAVDRRRHPQVDRRRRDVAARDDRHARPVGKIGVDVSANPDRIYAVVEAGSERRLCRSDDGAKTWQLMSDAWALHSRAWYYRKVFLIAEP
jgi:photosystem II stability/assembly factor-like uncharacterized protein